MSEMMRARIITEVLTEVFKERGRQDEKWGEQNHEPPFWLAILGEEFGEVCTAVLEWEVEQGEKDYRKELVQVAAVAVAMIECFDRNVEEGKS